MTFTKSHHNGTLSPEMALLGQLFAEPGHGYDLHRKVAIDLGQVWHLSQSQAYSILNRLVARGDITSEEIPQKKLPPRQWLRITKEGRQRFLEWLDTPSGGSTRAIRMEFITRLYFIGQYFPDRVARAFEAQKIEVQNHIHRLEEIRVGLPAGQLYNRMSLDLRLEQLKTTLAWLDEYQEHFKMI